MSYEDEVDNFSVLSNSAPTSRHMVCSWQYQSAARVMLACFAVAILLACVYYAGVYSQNRPSWGKFGGNCFEVLETGEAGCQASYANNTTVTLGVS